jgi:hypothetical protein
MVFISKPTMALQVFEPNQFVLHNPEIQITYSTGSRAGVPELDYQTQDCNYYHFSNDEIHVMETAIGRLVTVILESNFEQQQERILALLLPTVYLPVGVVERLIQTEAILITRRLPKWGRSRRVEGQVETYESRLLSGTARLVEFN